MRPLRRFARFWHGVTLAPNCTARILRCPTETATIEGHTATDSADAARPDCEDLAVLADSLAGGDATVRRDCRVSSTAEIVPDAKKAMQRLSAPDSSPRRAAAQEAGNHVGHAHQGTMLRCVFPGQSACGGESVCTPDSVEDGHPSRPAVARRLQRSTRELDGPPAPCLTLLQVGFTEPPGSPRALVRSYRTVAPLPVPGEPGHRRSVLCGTFLRVAPTGCYPAPCPVESGRSSDGSSPYATIQPAHHRRGIIARRAQGPGQTGPERGTRPMGRDSSAEHAGEEVRRRRSRSRGRRCGATRSSPRRHRTPRRRRSGRGCGPG